MSYPLRLAAYPMLFLLIASCAHDNTSSLNPSAAAAESNVGLAIMPLGDSITFGAGDDQGTVHGGYRVPLYGELQMPFHFVGSQFNGPATLLDHRHEGHPGYTIGQIQDNIDTWLAYNLPDIILLHIGTNDVAQNLDLTNAPLRLHGLIARIFSDAPRATLFVAQIVPFDPGSDRDQQVTDYNQGVAAVVADFQTSGAKIYLVDMHTGLDATDLSQDREHPISPGYAKMAARWAAAVNGLVTPGTSSLTSTGP